MNKIEWKTIPGYERYQVSEFGEVRRLKKQSSSDEWVKTSVWINKQTKYPSVTLYCNGVRKNETVHRLVAIAFIGLPPSSKHLVSHNDGSKNNNHWSNLRWDTQKGNMADTIKHGTDNRGSKNGQSKLDSFFVILIRKLLMANIPNKFIAQEFGICRQTVCDIKNRRRWAHLPDPKPMKYSNGELVNFG